MDFLSRQPVANKWTPETFSHDNEEDILAWHDGPLVFLLRDEEGAKYLAYIIDGERSDENHYDDYLVFTIDETTSLFRDFLEGTIDIRSYFEGHESCLYLHYVYSKESSTITTWQISASEIPDDLKPEAGVTF